MPSSLQPNVSAAPAGRLRAERVADGVVAGYIREISRAPRPAIAAAPSSAATLPALSRAAGGARVRAAARRRRHTALRPRPATPRAACLGA